MNVNLLKALRSNWRIYLIEAWALGMFMVSASLFVIIIEHPDLPVRNLIESAVLRRVLIGLAMGVTAVLLIYSKWGKLSGAQMNPAVTVTFLFLHRIRREDALWYIVFQFAGGFLGVAVFKWLLYDYISSPAVNYVVTLPGIQGLPAALGIEFLMSALLIAVVLASSNNARTAPYTGFIVGLLLLIYITVTAPITGMSINPARSVASSLNSGEWHGWWLYFLGPVSGMLTGGYFYRAWYRRRNRGDCTTMSMHLSGYQHDCTTYDVFGPKRLLMNKTGLGEQQL
ncbi:MAG: aquaporin [Bacteroidales bacterium]|nr:aquaporin [Bacteroidales bacterium]MDT8374240.1 aquaporin [Bacteroidales bacterium]